MSSWSEDAIFAALALSGAALLAVRHLWRRPVRVVMIIFLAAAFAQALLLPITASRYCYYLTPLPVLLAAAVLVAGARSVVKLVPPAGLPAWRAYGRSVGGLSVLAAVVLASGIAIELADLPLLRVTIDESRRGRLRFPDEAGPARFLRENVQSGDVVLASRPNVIEHYLSDLSVDFWPQSRLETGAVLDDRRASPLHHLGGTVMAPTRQTLEEIFARHERVWYVLAPNAHYRYNVPQVSAFVREHMDVVYEDFLTMVLFRGASHRPAWQRQEQDEELLRSLGNYLP
jgi:hypothetical protein